MKKPFPFTFIVVAAFYSCIQMGCDRDNPASVPRNSQPVIEGIADIVVDAGAETTVEVSITDADAEDNQTLHASSDDTAIATVSVSNSTLTISGIAGGVTAITVSATDDSEQDNAESEPVTFRVTVDRNSQPVIEGIEMIAPHRQNRTKKKTQDGRRLRRYVRRWMVERFFAWLQWQRRVITRWELYPENFLGFVQLASILILLKQFQF